MKNKKWSKFKIGMYLIAVVSTILTVALFVLNELCNIEILKTFAITFMTIAYHFDIRLIIGNVIPKFKGRINTDSRYFQSAEIEKIFYEKIKVKSWKSKVPTYNPDEFDMKKHSVEELIINTCLSEIIHTVNVIISYIPIIFSIWFGAAAVFIITSVLASVYDLQFVILQRYNKPRLLRIAERKHKGGKL